MTQSGHEWLRIAAAQTDPGTQLRRSQILAVIVFSVSNTGAVFSLGEGNAATRFRQSNRWISDCGAAYFARAAANDAGQKKMVPVEALRAFVIRHA